MNRYKHDDPAQRFLREVVHPEIAAVLQKHSCGAVVITCSKEAAAWITVLPDWGALRPDPNPAGMRFTAKRDDPDQHEKLELGLHFQTTTACVWSRPAARAQIGRASCRERVYGTV